MMQKYMKVYLIEGDRTTAWKEVRKMTEEQLLARLEYESMKPAEPESWTGRIQKQVFGKR